MALVTKQITKYTKLEKPIAEPSNRIFDNNPFEKISFSKNLLKNVKTKNIMIEP